MLPAIVDLKDTQGDTFSQTFRLYENGAPVNLTGSTMAAQYIGKTGAAKPFTVTLGVTTGEFTLTLATPATYGPYRYDVQQTDASAKVRTWIKGRFDVVKDVTNAIA